LLKLLT